ncbi:hypothetical protein [Pseudaminobacter sp. NGMCC 1.201702]|uniref:hypothetical protein n=1 Tax=Pseudaminobacter sp. NGMCC 1.201702 TaxID=3391825 RepID=UPI0039EE4D85
MSSPLIGKARAGHVSFRSLTQILLIDETLANGYVEVVLEREGVWETWMRGSGLIDNITVSVHVGLV